MLRLAAARLCIEEAWFGAEVGGAGESVKSAIGRRFVVVVSCLQSFRLL